MPKFDSPLNNVRIASPCHADWKEMYGDGRQRFCGDCKLNVYNLSGMTRDEAEALIMNAEGRLCVRFYKRADGSVITQDCPVGWIKVKQRAKVFATAVFSLMMALISGVFFVSLFSRQTEATMGVLKIPFAIPVPEQHTMGAMAVRPGTNSNARIEPEPGTVMGNFVGPARQTKSDAVMGKMRITPPNHQD